LNGLILAASGESGSLSTETGDALSDIALRALFFDFDCLGRVVAAPDGRILASNRAADALLQEADCVWRQDGFLRARRMDDNARLGVALSQPTRCAHTYLASSNAGRAPALIKVSNFAPPNQPRLALLKLWRAKMPSVTRLRPIAVASGLTLTQQRVIVHLVRGLDPEAIARRMRITTQTARTHIRNIYLRLGINSRVELFQLVLQYSA